MPFDTQEEMDVYLEHEDYGQKEDKPGICFGFSIIEHAENKYELELQFNDEYPKWNRAMP